MQRLSGLDDTFLWMETPSSYMHVASLIVVDSASVEGGLTFERIRALYASRLDQAPPFRRRLVEVPFGLHHPLWIEDPDFDLNWHLRSITMPEDRNSLHDLADLAARLNAIHLDRTRPLWELWIIDGVEDDHVGLLTKVHHAAIDGASGEELMVAILDLEPDPEPRPEPEVPWKADPLPTDTELLAYATWSLAQQPIKTKSGTVRITDTSVFPASKTISAPCSCDTVWSGGHQAVARSVQVSKACSGVHSTTNDMRSGAITASYEAACSRRTA